MKAVQSRSPIILYYDKPNLDKVVLKMFFAKNPNDLKVVDTPVYELESKAINSVSKLEVSELIRSENQYEASFYQNKDTAVYVLCQAELINSQEEVLEVRHDFLRIRDGYVERTEPVQLFKNEIPTNFTEWDLAINAGLFEGEPDQFNGNNATLVQAINQNNNLSITQNLDLNGVYTFSVFVENLNTDTVALRLGTDANRVIFDLNNNTASSVGANVLAYDIFNFSTYSVIAISVDASITNSQIFCSAIQGGVELNVFSPMLVKGNWLQNTPNDLLLQDNTTIYSDGNIAPQILLDKKEANTTYSISTVNLSAFFSSNLDRQSLNTDRFGTLTYDELDGTTQTLSINEVELCEPKYTPVKVSFVNRFGVIQDLVFFKKRVDSYNTKSENYKANPMQSGEVVSTIGQKKIFNKTAEAKLKLSSGFYPESFNTVFKQLLYSELVWVNDEPVVLTSSSWTEKTSLNDKLINYVLDFDFANNDINNIR